MLLFVTSKVVLLCILAVFGFMYFVIANYSRYPRMVLDETPGNYGLPFEEVDFYTRDRLRLRGWFIPYSPDCPTIVLCHGVGVCRQQVLPLAPFLYRKGFNFLLFDFRGHGVSEGSRTSFGCLEKLDLEAALDFLKNDNKLNNHKIGLWGISMGASVSIMVAPTIENVCAVVADSPYDDLSHTMAYHLWKRFHLPRIPFFYVGRIIFNRIFHTRMQNVSPLSAVKSLAPRSLLLIHGSEDNTIPPHCAEAIFENASQPKELWMVSQAGHFGAYDSSRYEYEDKVAGFFSRFLLE